MPCHGEALGQEPWKTVAVRALHQELYYTVLQRLAFIVHAGIHSVAKLMVLCSGLDDLISQVKA